MAACTMAAADAVDANAANVRMWPTREKASIAPRMPISVP